MTKKILIIGHSDLVKSELMLQKLKEEYGNDIVLVTPEEAKEQGLKPEDFDNIPKYKITAPPMMDPFLIAGHVPTGRDNRRNRRKKERKK